MANRKRIDYKEKCSFILVFGKMVWYGQPQTQEAGIHKTWSYDKLQHHILAGKRESVIHNYG